jgi:hypothetical protein
MSDRAVKVTVEWALRGKSPNPEGQHILGWSTGELSRQNFEEASSMFLLGAPVRLPQIAVSFVPGHGGGQGAYVTLAIHDSGAPDRASTRRPNPVTRYFCVPYRELTEAAISYQALYEAFSSEELPDRTGRVRTRDVAVVPPELARPGDLALRVAALLLSGGPVCVLGAEDTTPADRLAFIDTVMTLLPYGLRTRMAAATWTGASYRDHRFKLFFSDAARPDSPHDHVVSWGEPGSPATAPENDHAARYLGWLTATVSQPMALLAGLTDPMGFSSTSVSRALDRAGVLAEEAGPTSAAGDQAWAEDPTGPLPRLPADPTEAVLLQCVAELGAQNAAGLTDCISALRTIYAAQPDSARPGPRGRYQRIVTQYQLLRPGLRLHGHEDEFYDMVLELAFGTPLDYQGYCQIEDCLHGADQPAKPRRPSAALSRSVGRAAQAGVTDGAADIRVLALAAHSLGGTELTRFLGTGRMDLGQLIAALAEKWDRPQHAEIVEDVAVRYLRSQPAALFKRQALRTALQAHGYLAPALQLRYPDSSKRQTDLLEELLDAAYPKGLDAATARAILAASSQSTTLLAVVLRKISNTTDTMAIVNDFWENQPKRGDGGRP